MEDYQRPQRSDLYALIFSQLLIDTFGQPLTVVDSRYKTRSVRGFRKPLTDLPALVFVVGSEQKHRFPRWTYISSYPDGLKGIAFYVFFLVIDLGLPVRLFTDDSALSSIGQLRNVELVNHGRLVKHESLTKKLIADEFEKLAGKLTRSGLKVTAAELISRASRTAEIKEKVIHRMSKSPKRYMSVGAELSFEIVTNEDRRGRITEVFSKRIERAINERGMNGRKQQ
jgi:hypothetical protein